MIMSHHSLSGAEDVFSCLFTQVCVYVSPHVAGSSLSRDSLSVSPAAVHGGGELRPVQPRHVPPGGDEPARLHRLLLHGRHVGVFQHVVVPGAGQSLRQSRLVSDGITLACFTTS